MTRTFPSRLRWLSLTLFIVLADRTTKALIESRTTEGWHRELIHNFMYLVHSKNPGIAFSVFANSQSPYLKTALITLSLLFIAVLAWLLITSQSATWRTLAGLSLLIGGAAGNLTDRILHGAVTDFFELWFGSYRYPAFNVADSAITVGAILVLLDVLFASQKKS
ncbi:MAG: signal peptidase II [Acidobacteria bacterium]|nr:signal peptidase II [Acidobacteriota bacterium]MBS1865329.1 signal peptidase II [Acidobacteriota bacterium]